MNPELAEFASAVRDSTLKRLRLVPAGAENWRVDPDAMSFADTAQHLVDSDRWLFQTLDAKTSIQMDGRSHILDVQSRFQYESVLDELRRSGEQRRALLSLLGQEALQERVVAAELGGEVTAWWAIVRGNLDHEIHHRGQVAAYLRTLRVSVP